MSWNETFFEHLLVKNHFHDRVDDCPTHQGNFVGHTKTVHAENTDSDPTDLKTRLFAFWLHFGALWTLISEQKVLKINIISF